jgi:hypothetical protein
VECLNMHSESASKSVSNKDSSPRFVLAARGSLAYAAAAAAAPSESPAREKNSIRYNIAEQ